MTLRMSAELTLPPRADSAGRWSAPRSCLVIDPIWKVIDAATYHRTWDALNREAELYGFVGFDMEWTTRLLGLGEEEAVDSEMKSSSRPTKQKPRRWTGPVATIQLSTFSCTVVVRWNHLHALVSGNASDILCDPYACVSSSWPSYRIGQKVNPLNLLREVYTNVKEMIANPRIFLVGVGIHGDEVKLHRDYPKITAESAVELTALAEACLPDLVVDNSIPTSRSGVQKVRTDSLQSLKKLCAALTGKELGKDMFVVMSDWGGCHGALTSLQIEYSANDAEASYDVCAAILTGGGFLQETPFADDVEDGHARSEPWVVARGVDCREVLACCTTKEGRANNRSSPTPAGVTTKGQLTTPLLDLSASAAMSAEEKGGYGWCKGRSKPYYDNINVYSPDMQLVFTVDKTKADWYVNKKGLAKVIEWRPPNAASSPSECSPPCSVVPNEREIAAIQLTFTPDSTRYNDTHIRRNLEYFKQPKENICVVCGEGGSLVRFAVVPLMYRRFFPSVYMSHNSYDLLLLCPRCFAKSRQLYDRLRLDVAEDFGIPLVHLRGDQREAYAQKVEQMEQECEALSHEYEKCHHDQDTALSENPGKDCHLPPNLKLQGMLDYLSLMGHLEVLDKVFSYAKALHAHYQSESPQGVGGSAGLNDEGIIQVALPSPTSPGERKVKRHGVRVVPPRAGKAAVIPEERRRMMADFLGANAPSYPFYAQQGGGTAEVEQRMGDPASDSRCSTLDDHAWQSSVFKDPCGGPASCTGVLFILTGCVAAPPTLDEAAEAAEGKGDSVLRSLPRRVNTSRSVLTRYWLDLHPELLTTLPTVTRVEEHQRKMSKRAGADKNAREEERLGSSAVDTFADSDASGVPYVDSHAFLVVQLLLRKYKEGDHSGRTAEHAVGQFIYRWRSSFVEGMKPQYLPNGWAPEDGILR